MWHYITQIIQFVIFIFKSKLKLLKILIGNNFKIFSVVEVNFGPFFLFYFVLLRNALTL